jgi:hypothetical protein
MVANWWPSRAFVLLALALALALAVRSQSR